MKEIFDTVRTALMATGDWKYIDANDGQLDNGDDFALLPAALIDINDADWQGGDATMQVGMLQFTVDYAFRKMANASSISADKSYQVVMKRFDTVKAATAALINKTGATHGRIGRKRTGSISHKEFWILRETYLCTVADTFE